MPSAARSVPPPPLALRRWRSAHARPSHAERCRLAPSRHYGTTIAPHTRSAPARGHNSGTASGAPPTRRNQHARARL